MSYAEHRKIIDADSHVIELEDFLISAADREDKKVIPSMSSQKELPVVEAGLESFGLKVRRGLKVKF